MAKRKDTAPEMFSARRMEAIVEQLRAEGRMPSEQEFVRSLGRLREKYRPLILEERKKSGSEKILEAGRGAHGKLKEGADGDKSSNLGEKASA